MFIVRRAPENPILVPRRENPWEAFGAYNPSVVKGEDGYKLFYRALADPAAPVSPYAGQSTIGLARSEDGVHFHSRQQVLAPAEGFDAFGCEDPRATFFEGKWYLFYTALGGYPFGPDNIKVGCAVGSAPDRFEERHLVTPFNAKAATLFPERIDGEVVLLLTAHTDSGPHPTIAIARAKNIEDFWNPGFWDAWHEKLEEHAIADLRRSDADHIEVGGAPVKTERGWLLLYSYIQNYYDERKRVFGVEAALLDPRDPRKSLARTYPFLVPEEIYELYGTVPNIVFPTSALAEGDTLSLYYGAADTTCAKATIKLSDLLDALSPSAGAGFIRAKENPILTPRGDSFESRATLNAAAVELAGSIHLLYRAMSNDNTSTFGYARSKDGIHIEERLDKPAYAPRADFEMKKGPAGGNSGCEDPRLVALDDRLYLTYTAYDGAHNPRGAVSSIAIEDFLAKRFEKWSLPVLATPDDVDDKDVGLLPEPSSGGHYVLYHRIAHRVCADLLPDLAFGKRASRCIEIMAPRPGMWDSAKIGIAGPPIKIGVNWLLIYHGISDHGVYRLGAAMLSTDGLSVLSRTADPILEPVEQYELAGEVGKVVFSCGAVARGNELFLYYGGADKVLGVATASLSRIVKALS
jgi:predicted GH43/DUF377 family glycosyl hydrolase